MNLKIRIIGLVIFYLSLLKLIALGSGMIISGGACGGAVSEEEESSGAEFEAGAPVEIPVPVFAARWESSPRFGMAMPI